MTDTLKKSVDQRLLWAEQNPTLCIYPYVTLDTRYSEFSSEPVFKTCCCSLDDRTFVPSAGADPFADIKEQQLNEQWPEACWRCKSEEDHGGASERVNGFLGYIEDRLKSFVEKQTLPEFELRVKFSNFCNLACRSCTETESSTWARITNTPVSEQYEIDISTSPEHWELITTTILEKLPKVEHFYVHFIGGESLVQPGMKKLLNWMIAQGIAPRVHLRVTTALSVRPGYDLMSKMSQFRDVDINLSIDSVGDNYQYLRWPAKFEKIENNLATLMSHFMTYWSAWFDQQHYSFPIQPINLIDRTQHLDIEALPIRYRATLIKFLQTCLEHKIFRKYPNQTRMLFNFISSTIEELKNMPESHEQWLKFLSHNAYFDKKTDQSFAMLNERLYNLLDAPDKELIDIMTNDIDIEKQFSQEITHRVAFFKKLDVQS